MTKDEMVATINEVIRRIALEHVSEEYLSYALDPPMGSHPLDEDEGIVWRLWQIKEFISPTEQIEIEEEE